ncbi:hypothetical protein FC92_GL001042 [Liquorilactobacillus hordei DSM 19519]|uniref:Uncharacterized protein n=2 Tax=Liquorilactobacillus hordei TaxID=468911 RepID=A0A0R1MS54_9LACO|nr:hypothetical protein FC92_GL001042 [Liquorilactobacillus hordei DSM 19519]
MFRERNSDNFRKVKVTYTPEPNDDGTTTYYPRSWQYLSKRNELMFNEDQMEIIEWIHTYWYKYGENSMLEAIMLLINSGLYEPSRNPTFSEVPMKLEEIWDSLGEYSRLDIIHEVTTICLRN